MDDAEKIALHAKYDKRKPYAFAPFGKPDPRTGAERYRGPALRKILRCPSDPRSMRLGHDRKTTECQKATDTNGKRLRHCGCALTVTVDADEFARERQELLWGTTDHAASYGRRNGVENVNSYAKANGDIHFGRGFIRVIGAARNHALATFALAGMNVRKLRNWNITRLAADPWLTAIGDTSDPDWKSEHGHRAHRPRKKALHERLVHRDIPRRTNLSAKRNRRPKPPTGSATPARQ